MHYDNHPPPFTANTRANAGTPVPSFVHTGQGTSAFTRKGQGMRLLTDCLPVLWLARAANRMSSHDAVENEYFQEIRDLPAAQIPYVNTPELDPDDFIYDNAKNLSTQDLRATMYGAYARMLYSQTE